MRTCSFVFSASALSASTMRPGLEHVAAVRGVERHQRVLLDEQDRRALLVDLLDDVEDPLDEDRREPERRLVEQQQLRARHQRAADRAHLLLAARHRPGLLRRAARAGAGRARRRDPCRSLISARSLRWNAPISRFSITVMRGKSRRPSGDCAIPRLTISCAGDRGDVAALEADRALARPVEPVDRAQRRRLAGAVRAEQRHDLALVHLERDPLQRVDRRRSTCGRPSARGSARRAAFAVAHASPCRFMSSTAALPR